MPLLHWLGNLSILATFCGSGIYVSRFPWGKYLLPITSVTVALLGFLFRMRPDLLLQAVPWTNWIYYLNWYSFAAALLIPLLVRLGKTPFHRLRIALLCLLLFLTSLADYRIFLEAPAVTGPPEIDNNGICRQTSASTCAAASVVTLLRQYGIHVTEKEAATHALTRKAGTTPFGVYRALSILTANAATTIPLSPHLHYLPVDELIKTTTPAIITVGIPVHASSREYQELAQKYEWTPGVMHDVVYLGPWDKDPSKLKIGEPDFGLEYWPADHLRLLYQGFAFRIESVPSLENL